MFQSRGCASTTLRVLADGRVEPSLAQELLTLFQRAVAVEGQGDFSAGPWTPGSGAKGIK